LDIQTIEFNFNRGQMNLEQIQWLIETIKGLEEQANLMAEKAAEKDIAMEEFMRIIEEQKANIRLYQLKETMFNQQLKLKDEEIKTLKKSVRFEVFQENLALAEEIALLKEGVKA
jgi:hypothetical protein